MPYQPDLLPRSKSPKIPISDNHPLIQLTDALDWDQMQDLAQQIPPLETEERCRK